MRKPYREEVAAKWILWGYHTPEITNYIGPLYLAGTASARMIDQMLLELAAAKPTPKRKRP